MVFFFWPFFCLSSFKKPWKLWMNPKIVTIRCHDRNISRSAWSGCIPGPLLSILFGFFAKIFVNSCLLGEETSLRIKPLGRSLMNMAQLYLTAARSTHLFLPNSATLQITANASLWHCACFEGTRSPKLHINHHLPLIRPYCGLISRGGGIGGAA